MSNRNSSKTNACVCNDPACPCCGGAGRTDCPMPYAKAEGSPYFVITEVVSGDVTVKLAEPIKIDCR